MANVNVATTYLSALITQHPAVNLTTTYLQVLVGPDDRPYIGLPKNIAGLDAVAQAVMETADNPLDRSWFAFGVPQPHAGEGLANTRITVTATLNAPLRGSDDLYYNRLAIDDLFDEEKLPGWTSCRDMADFRALIEDLYGILLSEEDLVPRTTTATGAVLEAASTSYFFIPGTRVTLGIVEPSLFETFTVTDLSGFEPPEYIGA
ncbi:hypothetical protein ACLPJK_25660 [Pseudomonas aeruginosa]|uniref:DUF7941 domain-family protein n=1 Tax=Pseudomonas aeruginosa TaxID=287 RepID=UPI003D29497F